MVELERRLGKNQEESQEVEVDRRRLAAQSD
jgi:hypothetical protein